MYCSFLVEFFHIALGLKLRFFWGGGGGGGERAVHWMIPEYHVYCSIKLNISDALSFKK